jgi:hypothetical protein
MLNAMSLLSRFSRSEKNLVERVVLNALPVRERKIHAGITGAGCKPARLTQCALEKFV